MTIDSVVPPSVLTLGWTWSSAREGFDNLFAGCAAQPACHARYPDLAATFDHLAMNLETHPITTEASPGPGLAPVKVVIDGGALINTLLGSLRPFTEVPAAIDELAHGHPERIAAARVSAARPAKPNFAYGLTYSVFCAEMVPYGTPAELLAAGRSTFRDYPTPVLAQAPQLPFEHEDCTIWNVPKAPAAQR